MRMHLNVCYILQDNNCMIDGVCYAAHETSHDDACQVCLPDHANDTWSASNGKFCWWKTYLVLFEENMSRYMKKVALFFSVLWFFKCACAVFDWGYRHAVLSEASSGSLLAVCEQQRRWQDCAYVQAHLSLCWSHISTLFSYAGCCFRCYAQIKKRTLMPAKNTQIMTFLVSYRINGRCRTEAPIRLSVSGCEGWTGDILIAYDPLLMLHVPS